MQRQAIAGVEDLSLHHLYRTMGFLGVNGCQEALFSGCEDAVLVFGL